MFAIHFICVGALVLAMAAFNGLAGENDLGQGQGNDGVEVPQVGGNGAPPRYSGQQQCLDSFSGGSLSLLLRGSEQTRASRTFMSIR